jgi:acyl carrier protein
VERLTVEWAAEILEEQVAPEDNFLDLGGHSLLALELCQRVKDAFGMDLDVQVLFEKSVRETVAAAVDAIDPNTQNG